MKFLITVKNPDLRAYLKDLINSNNDDCFSIENVQGLIHAYREYKPDFVILDIDLRNNMAFRIAEKMKTEFPDSKFLMVSDFDDFRLRRRTNKISGTIFIPKENLFELFRVIEKINQ